MKELLKDKNFRLLYSSVICSGIGTGISLIAINWAIINMFGLSTYIATLTAITNIAIFLLLPIISFWLDKYSRQKILAGIFLFGSIVQFIAWGCSHTYGVSISILFISGMVSGLLRAGDQTARTVLSKQLFRKDQYQELNRCLEVARQVITFAAGGVGTLMITYIGVSSVLLLDSITYFSGFLLIMKIQSEFKSTKSPSKKSFLQGFQESVGFLKRHKDFFVYSSITMVPYITVVTQNVLYPAHFKQFLGLEGGAFAFLSIPYGAGAIFSAWLSAFLKKSLNRDGLIKVSFLFYILALLLVFLIKSVLVTYCCLFFIACSHSMIRIERMTHLMDGVHGKMAGRVVGFFDVLSLGVILFLSLAVGYTADTYGIESAWSLIFSLLVMSFILFQLTSKRKKRLSSTGK